VCLRISDVMGFDHDTSVGERGSSVAKQNLQFLIGRRQVPMLLAPNHKPSKMVKKNGSGFGAHRDRVFAGFCSHNPPVHCDNLESLIESKPWTAKRRSNWTVYCGDLKTNCRTISLGMVWLPFRAGWNFHRCTASRADLIMALGVQAFGGRASAFTILPLSSRLTFSSISLTGSDMLRNSAG